MTLRDELLRFVTQLRAAGVRISVAETLDSMNAVAAAGIERTPMREALAATLIKDESDRPLFDTLFSSFFVGPRERSSDERRRGSESSIAPGMRPHGGDAVEKSREEPRESGWSSETAQTKTRAPSPADADSSEVSNETESEQGEKGEQVSGEWTADNGDAGRTAKAREVERRPFEKYSDLEYFEARDALAPIARRFRVRLGRRLKVAKTGRLDFRCTIRGSIQRGGAITDLRFRSRRPRHIDLLILADISGSVRYSSTLMLELIAGAQKFFRRVRSFVYIDRLAEAELEQGHLVMTPALDMYARSDFGRVLAEVWNRRGEILNRATVLVVMGDGRNNRRPPRADLLREIAKLCRAVIWLNPEERARWGSGDSAIFQYEREAGPILNASNLLELERALAKIA